MADRFQHPRLPASHHFSHRGKVQATDKFCHFADNSGGSFFSVILLSPVHRTGTSAACAAPWIYFGSQFKLFYWTSSVPEGHKKESIRQGNMKKERKPLKIRCKYCGATKTRSGKPFTVHTIKMHAGRAHGKKRPPRMLGLTLSEREVQVLKLVSTGLSNHSISRRLRLSPFTISCHLRNCFAKLGVHTRAQAIAQTLKQFAPPEAIRRDARPARSTGAESNHSFCPDCRQLLASLTASRLTKAAAIQARIEGLSRQLFRLTSPGGRF